MGLLTKKTKEVLPLVVPEPPKPVVQEKAKFIQPIDEEIKAEQPLQSSNNNQVEESISGEESVLEEPLESENEANYEQEAEYPMVITENQLINMKLDKILQILSKY